MKILVTGSSGHLGQAVMRLLPEFGHHAVGLDIKPGAQTAHLGSIADPEFVADTMSGLDAVIHTATLHKPHVVTHSRQEFVDVNISGTLTLLEAAKRHGISKFVFTSTTSAFGAALTPLPEEPAIWIDRAELPVSKNIYGATKCAAEDLCQLYARKGEVASLVLRMARFFPEEDDSPETRAHYADQNAKANEFLFRRVDLKDAAMACLNALDQVEPIGFDRYVISATTPFAREDCAALHQNAPQLVARCFPQMEAIYAARGYRMFPKIGRVYDNARARRDLNWAPEFDFARILEQLAADQQIGSDLARIVGSNGYHDQQFDEGPFPVE